MTKFWLLVDDVRDSMGCDIVARNAEAAKELIFCLRGKLDCIIFDHDLGEGENGFNVLKWALENNLCPNKIQLVTNNPVGRQNMENILRDYDYSVQAGRFFSKG